MLSTVLEILGLMLLATGGGLRYGYTAGIILAGAFCVLLGLALDLPSYSASRPDDDSE